MVDHVKLKHRLALRLARYAVILAFAIGLLLSSLQVIGDYQNQESRIDETIDQILVVSRPPATRAVNTLDATLAEEVVNGLLQYPFVTSARIKDELDKDLAFSSAKSKPSHTRWITDRISSEKKTYEVELRTPDYVGAGPGHLVLVVNMDEALKPFFERSKIIILSGVARNFLLALVLMVLFYLALTRPLERLASQFLEVKNRPREQNRLSVEKSHENSELGLLCESGNQFIDTVQQLLKEQEQSAEALGKSEMRLHRLIDQIPQMVVAQNASGDILFSNQQFAHFYGRSLNSIRDFKLKGVTSKVLEMAHLDSIREKTLKSRAVTYINQLELTNFKGEKRTFSVQVAPFEYFSEPATLLVASDISKLIEAQAHIAHLANHDSLTGLPNRVMLNERITQAQLGSRASGEFNALLFLDLDHFKDINDSLGHAVGDQVLKVVADRLQARMRTNDTVARLGGDEFILLLKDLSKDKELAANFVGKACDMLLAHLSEPVNVGERSLSVGASIGIVLFPNEGQSQNDLLRYADIAMYRAKALGRNQAVFFTRTMCEEIRRRRELESLLFRASAKQQFEVHYQGIHDNGGEVVGYEALLRWHHPELGLMRAAEFLQVLESGGLVCSVGNWVVSECCRQLAYWQQSGFWQPHWRLAVNVSSSQLLQEDFMAALHQAVTTYGIDIHGICLEVKLAAIDSDDAQVLTRLNQLCAYGVKVALDGFGVSSIALGNLKDLPLDMIKIDRQLTVNLASDEKDRAVVRALVALSEAMSLQLVAEGIETEAQLSWAQQCGCRYFQGYHLDMPTAPLQLSHNGEAQVD